MFKRFFTVFLAASLVIGLLTFSLVSFHSAPSKASASSEVASHTQTMLDTFDRATSLSDEVENELPHGSYNNHLIHLHPASQIFAPTIFFNVTGGGLPTGASLVFWSDLGGRCTSNTVDGSTVVVTGDGSFGPQNFSADNCKVGNYLIEAIDPLGRVYNAILTVSS